MPESVSPLWLGPWRRAAEVALTTLDAMFSASGRWADFIATYPVSSPVGRPKWLFSKDSLGFGLVIVVICPGNWRLKLRFFSSHRTP